MKLLESVKKKLKIEKLNAMQDEARLAISHGKDVLLLSPTGTGKTLAFLLPLFEELKDVEGVQAIILAPSRELAMQIESVAKAMATGYKVNLVYGGRPIKKDFKVLENPPAVLIGTPGRVGDHLRRGTIDGNQVRFLFIDEYDKALELGFDETMEEINDFLTNLEKRVLTSATQGINVPGWLSGFKALEVNYLDSGKTKLRIKRVVSENKDKLQRLFELLQSLQGQRGIVFLNYKDSIQRTSDFLSDNGMNHSVFHGGLEQHDRERALIQFRNGSVQILLATDLAARGLDVPQLDYIIHYHLPLKAEEFTHRNGRTARMNDSGIAYVLYWVEDDLPEFIPQSEIHEVETAKQNSSKQEAWKTLFISGGRNDKISKGDIAGFCMKQGGLKQNELGLISLKQECAFVAVHASKAKTVVASLNNKRLKKRKVRVYQV